MLLAVKTFISTYYMRQSKPSSSLFTCVDQGAACHRMIITRFDHSHFEAEIVDTFLGARNSIDYCQFQQSPLTNSGFSLCLFRTMEYITDQTKFLPHSSPPLSLFKHSTIFQYTHTQCSFISHTHIYKQCSPLSFIVKKHYTFHTVNKK